MVFPLSLSLGSSAPSRAKTLSLSRPISPGVIYNARVCRRSAAAAANRDRDIKWRILKICPGDNARAELGYIYNEETFSARAARFIYLERRERERQRKEGRKVAYPSGNRANR